MRFHHLWLSVVVLAFTGGLAPAQESLLELLPEGACAFGVRDLSELKAKGDKFLKDADIPMNPRPSQMVEQAFRELRVQGAVNEKARALFMVFGPKAFPKKIQGWNPEKLSVAIIPIKDQKRLEKNFELKPGELKPGQVVKIKKQGGPGFGDYIYLRGKNLFIGEDADVVAYAAEKAPPLAKRLNANQKKSLKEADMVIHLALEAWGEQLSPLFLTGNAQNIIKTKDPEERKLVEQIIRAGRGVSYVLGAIRIDEGLGVNIVAGIRERGSEDAKKLLALLGSGKGVSGLHNLPKGSLLAAQGVRGNGKSTSMLAKVLLDQVFDNIFQTEQIISASERPIFVGVLKEVWERLKGSKTAVYINPNSRQQGLFSFLAVLDTRDAQEFLKEMKLLAKIAEGKKLDLTKKIEEGGEVDINKLIKDLGSPNYRTRAAATLKVRLVGEPALPHLDKAIKKKPSLEVVMRAEMLSEEIQTLAAERRKAALSKNPFKRIRPKFVMVTDVEKRAGHSVDVIRIQLSKTEMTAKKQLEEFLGPEWNNMRLAVHEDQVVLMLGSNMELFEQTLQNISQNKPGLARSKSLTELYRYSNSARKFELHVSLQNLLGLLPGGAQVAPPGQKTSALSSVGLSVEPDQLQLDVWMPISEIRILAKQANR